MAPVILPNIKPIIKSDIVSFTFNAMESTASSTKKLPRLDAKAKVVSLKIEKENTLENAEAPMMSIAAPKLAPELMPNTNGPAKGFLNKVCINKPHNDNPEPTKTAVIALGTL